MSIKMSRIALNKCRCGSTNLDAESDGDFPATIIECCKCGRMVGAGTLAEAERMWNAAAVAVEGKAA